MNLDRFSHGLPDPQEAKVITYCRETGMEIYDGQDYLLLPDGNVILDDMNILMGYFNVIRMTAGEEDKKIIGEESEEEWF